MADFNIALAELLQFEGGYVNNPNDSGGETYAGISRKWNSAWAGWEFIDAFKKVHTNLADLNAALKADAEVTLAVSQFYRHKYWNFDTITSQLAANKLFGMEVNFGQGSAVRILQQALVRLGAHVNLTGSLDPATLAAIQTQKEPDVLHALRAFSALQRVKIILAHPDQVEFAEGWLWRDCN
jgi:lysozyme family protein